MPRVQSGRKADSLSTPKLRLAHVTATFPPYKGGTGNVAWYLTRELAARRHDVHVLTADLGGERVAPPGVTVHRLRPLVRIGNAPALPGLFPAVRAFDLIHLHYPFFFGAEIVWAAARLFGVPYVVTYHNDVRLTGPLAPVPRVYHGLLGRHILSEAAALLFTTLDYARSSDARHLVERRRTKELPLGVDANRFTPRADDPGLRTSLQLAPHDVVVLFVASLDRAHYFKGLPVLLGAMSMLQDLPVHLMVVGDGDLRPMYETQTHDLGLGERVHFAGSVSDADLSRLYALSDLFVLPSVTRGEAFGLVLLEAMATGKPVIATDLPGVRAVVRSAGGGMLVRPHDAAALARTIRELACAPQERARLGQVGRSSVEANFTWHSVVEQLEDIYSGVVEQDRI